MSEITAPLRVAPATGEFRQGWPVVLACFCTATFAWGFGFYGLSVYFADLHATRGWPASLIASATTPDQRVVVSTLQKLAATVREQNIEPPAIVVIGDIVNAREQLLGQGRA